MKLNKLVSPILFIFLILFLIGNRVTNIECRVLEDSCPQDLIDLTQNLKGKSFFFSNFQAKLLDNQNQNTIYLLDSIKKRFPGTISITFKQEEIKYALIIADEKKFLGESGKVIPKESSDIKTTFEFNSPDELLIENSINNEYHKIFLSVAETLEKSSINEVNFKWNSNSEIIMETPNQPRYIFDKETIQTQTKKIDTIITAKELEEIEEPILEIDMRFDLPVLRTSQ